MQTHTHTKSTVLCYSPPRFKWEGFPGSHGVYFWPFPGYAVTTLNDGSTLYFVAGAPRSNHSGQVIVYTVNAHKQTAIIDSERGKQVPTLDDVWCSYCIYAWCTTRQNAFKPIAVLHRSGRTSEASYAPWTWTKTGWLTSFWWVRPCSWVSWRERRAGSICSRLPRYKWAKCHFLS